MTTRNLFSIVIPVYENEENIEDTIRTLMQLAQQLPHYDLELVFVNDGSKDNSYALLKKYQQQYPQNIVLVNLTRNFGQTPAIRQGLRQASGNCVGIISADLQDPPELFLEMIRHWEHGHKLVIAERTGREEGKSHSFISGLYWYIVRKYAVAGFPPGGFDFCLMDRQICDTINQIGEKNTSIFPLIFWLGYDHVIIPYTRKLRAKGKSQWTLAKKVMLTVNTFINFTYLPVRFMTVAGLTTSLLAFVYSVFILLRRLIYGVQVEGWTTIVMLNSILGGMILFSLGIIGEYLWRLLDEARQRPESIVDEVVRLHNHPADNKTH